jgi:PAS domain S-box-containing protein
MNYELTDLVDINQLQKLLDSFYGATHVPSGIVSRDGTVLTATGWRDICTKFHRVNPKTKLRCIESDLFMLEQLKNKDIIINHKCKNGIIDIGTPIVVEGHFLATIFSGQIFFEKPDENYFRKQAKDFGFDEDVYLEALSEIPIVNKEEHEKIVVFLKHLSEMISELGLRQLKILESQRNLMLSEERYELALNGSNDGMWDYRIKEGTFYASDRFLQILNYTKSEFNLYFSNYKEFVHPEDRDYFVKELEHHLRGHNTHFIQEVRIKANFDKYKWVLVRGAVILNDENIPVRMAGSLTDLSYQKNTEEQLKKEQTFSKTIIDHANAIICVWNHDGFLLQFNKYGEELSGYSDEEVLGYSWMNTIFKKEDGNEILRYIHSLSPEINSTQIEKSLYSKHGSLFTILWNTQVLHNEDGTIKNIIGIGLDITKRKNEEKSLTEFFANISHELKTPLNIIFCSIQLAELYNENPPNDNNLQLQNCRKSIKQNCYRLLRLVNNLIDITKFDSGFLEINMEACAIVNLLEDITQSVIPYTQSKGLELVFDTDIEEKIIYCDPDKVERIVLNLISNAIKFSTSPGIIYISLNNMEDGISFSVKDTGIGIKEEQLNIIFERFKQVNKSFTREQEGSGIGLSLAKALVELHNGSIEVKSSYRGGSEFIVKLPSNMNSYHNQVKTLNNKHIGECSNVEKVTIEFSDIYFT